MVKKNINNKCAPSLINRKWSCYSTNSLIDMAKAYNKNFSDKIPLNNSNIKSSKYIWGQLSKRLFDRCGNDEMCWKEQNFVKNLNNKTINKKTFKPKMPDSWKKNPKEWLNTTDINNVMKQYENKYKYFIYLGTVPRDCPMGISCHLSDIILAKMYKKHDINNVGLIYNLDLHNQSGSHWVAVFMDFKKRIITFFDSYSGEPPKLINDFILKCIKQMSLINVNLKYQINNKRHQYGGSECGVYSCYFIIKSLEGKTLKQINSKRISDKKMNVLRKELFT